MTNQTQTHTATRRAYAAWNGYASETSTGFGNTWSAYVFDSAAQRDAWLATRTDMASMKCTRARALKHTHREGDDQFLYNPITDEFIVF